MASRESSAAIPAATSDATPTTTPAATPTVDPATVCPPAALPAAVPAATPALISAEGGGSSSGDALGSPPVEPARTRRTTKERLQTWARSTFDLGGTELSHTKVPVVEWDSLVGHRFLGSGRSRPRHLRTASAPSPRHPPLIHRAASSFSHAFRTTRTTRTALTQASSAP